MKDGIGNSPTRINNSWSQVMGTFNIFVWALPKVCNKKVPAPLWKIQVYERDYFANYRIYLAISRAIFTQIHANIW